MQSLHLKLSFVRACPSFVRTTLASFSTTLLSVSSPLLNNKTIFILSIVHQGSREKSTSRQVGALTQRESSKIVNQT